MSIRSFAIFSLFCLITIDFQSFGQSVAKNYISANIGLSAPVGTYASSGNTNSTALLTSFATPKDQNSGASLLLPPTFSPYFSMEGAYYLNKFFGVAAHGAYAEMTPDGSGVQNSLNQLLKKGSGAFISQLTQGQSAQTQQLLDQLSISSKATVTNWKISTFLLGPTLSHNSGKFTFDFKALGGIMNVATPNVDADIDFSVSLLSGTIFRFSQPAVSKSLFAYQVGYGVRYSIMDYLAVRVYADYTSSLSADYDLTITTTSPSKDRIDFYLNLAGQQPLNITLLQQQHTRVNFPVSNLNVGIGLCFEFGSLAKKKKEEVESDIELQKQQ
jgi:hypothetical protein